MSASKAEWWRGAVIYQIYPRSFLDTNADGVGDLKGVFAALDYIADLGVDGVWLSPFFTSPMKDFGYDVADYCDVDPVFGVLSDFDAVLGKARQLGLKIIIDQVYSHTSDAHPWFQESRQNKHNPKADWYVWADPQPDGSPPTNWQSVFGGGAWAWDSRRRQYYLHNFLASQPDLNLHNDAVQNALLNVARFWLDRGVDGFRLDALNFAMHDPKLRDNPPAPVTDKPPERPFDYQRHLYNRSHPDIPLFLERLRTVTEEYEGVFTVAEVVGPEPLAEMKAFTEGNARLHSAYNFTFLYADQLTAKLTIDAVGAWGDNPNEGWPSWAFSNHDAPRVVSRWTDGAQASQAAKLFAMILLSLRGNAFLYQGEELGLPQADVPFALLQDPEAIANWPLTLGRDGARTPMPWRSEVPNAGFSESAPWLPVDPGHAALSVETQKTDPNSVLHFVRQIIALRKRRPELRLGDIQFIENADGLLAYYRTLQDKRALCVFNITEKQVRWSPPLNDRFSVIAQADAAPQDNGPPSTLAPYSGYLAIADKKTITNTKN
ncbi:alpha-glucosidase [Hyphococcus sp.]|uniref:alpha-glucosidase n=1 Tax=Hyphococcus sp. TaxID=2038636 RepID=UPI003CCBDA5D